MQKKVRCSDIIQVRTSEGSFSKECISAIAGFEVSLIFDVARVLRPLAYQNMNAMAQMCSSVLGKVSFIIKLL